jgi:hypothetical protein
VDSAADSDSAAGAEPAAIRVEPAARPAIRKSVQSSADKTELVHLYLWTSPFFEPGLYLLRYGMKGILQVQQEGVV